MVKINFQNNITKANADTFNTMQDNIENAINNVSIELDDEVSTSSTNGVENQAITNYVNSEISDTKDYVDGKVPTTIFTGSLKGTETTTLSGVKNKLIIYAMANGANIVYTMDIFYTSANNHASGLQWAYDTASGLEFYASEGNYNASTGVFTHARTGYVNIGTGTYTARNSTNTYFIYRIDTI